MYGRIEDLIRNYTKWYDDVSITSKDNLSIIEELYYLIRKKGEVARRINDVKKCISDMDDIIKKPTLEALNKAYRERVKYMYEDNVIDRTETNKGELKELVRLLNNMIVINNQEAQKLKEKLSQLLDKLTNISIDLDNRFDALKLKVANGGPDELISIEDINVLFKPKTNTVAKQHNNLDLDNISEQIKRYCQCVKNNDATDEMKKYQNFFELVLKELREIIMNEPLNNLLPKNSDDISLEEKNNILRQRTNSILKLIEECNDVLVFINNRINESNNSNYQQTEAKDDIVH